MTGKVQLEVGKCPYCGAHVDGHAAMGGAARSLPIPGDYCVCIFCLNVGRYQQTPFGMTLRQLTAEEYRQLL